MDNVCKEELYFIKEKNQAKIFEEGAPKFENPFKGFVEAAKNGFTKRSAKNPKKVVKSQFCL